MPLKKTPPFLSDALQNAKTASARSSAALKALRQAAAENRVDDLREARHWISPSRFEPILREAAAHGRDQAVIHLLSLLPDLASGIRPEALFEPARAAIVGRHVSVLEIFARHSDDMADFVFSRAAFQHDWLDISGPIAAIAPQALQKGLSEAALQRKFPVVEALLRAGVPPLLDALEKAAEGGDPECVKLFLPLLDPKANRSAPLCAAASQARHACMELLIPLSGPDDLSLAWEACLPGPNPKRAQASQDILKRAMAHAERDALSDHALRGPSGPRAPRL